MRCYRFGSFVVDTQTRELRGGDAPVALSAKAFDTLCVLIEQRHRVVSKDELLATVWAGRVVEENNLTQAVSALRHALGTGAGDRRYVVTVPGRGYRFVADVVEGDPPDVVPPPAHDIPPRRRRTPAIVIGAIAAALLLAVVAWRMRERPPPAAPPAPVAASAQMPARPPPVVVVLPFHPQAPDTGQGEWLGLGLAATLGARIGESSALRVYPLSSSSRFADEASDPLQTARRLGVDYVVEGSTRREGDDVRIDMELRAAADGRMVWKDGFVAPADRVFAPPERIADGLFSALSVKAAARGHRSPCDGDDADAYRAYLRGQYHMGRPSPERVRQAVAEYRRAIDLDPTCARAYAGMAYAYRARVMTADIDPNEDFPLAKAMVEKALMLDPDLAEAYLARGWIQFWYDWDWAGSEASFKRAIALNPSLAEAHFGYAHLLHNLGRHDASAAQGRKAFQLDPLSPVINAIGGGGTVGAAGRNLDRALELDPDYWLALLMRGGRRAAAGDLANGLADLERARQLCGDCSHALTTLGLVKARAGDTAATRAILRTLQARDRAGYVPASDLAKLHNILGESDTAMDLLERGYRERDTRMIFLGIDATRQWKNLRGTPRFTALIERMGLSGVEAPPARTNTPPTASTPAAARNSR